MQSSNGVAFSVSPPPESIPTAAAALPVKRKHDDIIKNLVVNGEDTANDRNDSKDIQDSIRDIWQVLNAQDISPAILQRISTYHETNHDRSDNEPIHKRAKLSPSAPNHTLASKISHGHYESFDAFLEDFENACSDLLKSNQPKDDTANGPTRRSTSAEPPEHDCAPASLLVVKKSLRSLLFHEKQKLELKVSKTTQDAEQEQEKGVKINGTSHRTEPARSAPIVVQNDGTVLTLYGNAQGHKQLFSSLRKPVTHSNHSKDTPVATQPENVPFRENGLPVGISSTKIVPVLRDATAKIAKPKRTIQDVFAPPSSTRNLPPPKTPKLVTARESAITWSKGTSPEQKSRYGGYADEKLATGTWLGYGGLAPAEEPSSPQAKRKQRDRALSIGEASLTPSRGTKAAQLQAEEDAAFRSAYSSFAPSRDNSSALVPEETRNEIWWGKYGANCFLQEAAIDPSLESQDGESILEEQFEDKKRRFQEAAEHFVPTTLLAAAIAPGSGNKEAEELLLEISQMLETLHSYQRIRMASLSASYRTSLVQNSTLQDLTGNPSTPSTAEVETYKTLKSQLALIVSMLPPYAISKLNGDQLADLNISYEIPIEVEEYRGVMEEDKASRDAKQAAFQAAVGAAAATNRQPLLQPESQHHTRTAQMPQSARSHHQHQSQHSNTPQTMPKAQSQFSRQPLSSWQKPSQNFTANTQRPAYANPQSFNQSISRNVNPVARQSYSHMIQPRQGILPHLANGHNPAMPQQLVSGPRGGNHGSPPYTPNHGSYAASSSPSKINQRNFQPHMQYQAQYQAQNHLGQMQQSYTPQASTPQHNAPVSQSPRDQQHYNNQNQENFSQPAQSQTFQPSQPLAQPAPLLLLPPTAAAVSPLPRPTSSASFGIGLEVASGNGDANGVAVASRTPTPVAPVQAPAQTPAQTPVQTPVQDPVQDPVQAPVQTLVQTPAQAPLHSPPHSPPQAPPLTNTTLILQE